MASDNIFVFFGYSGDEGKKGRTPSFPDGVDRNKSFGLTAETLGNILQHWFMSSTVIVRQAWTKDKIVSELERASGPIRQVHVVAHGDPTSLSLARDYDRKGRIQTRARKFNAKKNNSNVRALEQWREEDALVAGYLSHALDPKRLAAIKAKHTKDACWQLWGCFAGAPEATFGHTGEPALDMYFRRFGLGKTTVPSISVDIAKSLGVICTGAMGGGGMEFWHGTGKGRAARNGTVEQLKKPYWLWLTKKAEWVSYDASGSKMPEVTMFQWTWDQKYVSGASLPQWLIDAYVY